VGTFSLGCAAATVTPQCKSRDSQLGFVVVVPKYLKYSVAILVVDLEFVLYFGGRTR
jgi:hypothetical protein